MRIYINPLAQTNGYDKASIILGAEGVREISLEEFLAFEPGTGGLWPVCLVGNPGFVAAALAFSREESANFCDPRDTRPRILCLIPESTLASLDPRSAAQLAEWRAKP